eukprot:13712227-Heterocapsa_arctica.AAC.1
MQPTLGVAVGAMLSSVFASTVVVHERPKCLEVVAPKQPAGRSDIGCHSRSIRAPAQRVAYAPFTA